MRPIAPTGSLGQTVEERRPRVPAPTQTVNEQQRLSRAAPNVVYLHDATFTLWTIDYGPFRAKIAILNPRGDAETSDGNDDADHQYQNDPTNDGNHRAATEIIKEVFKDVQQHCSSSISWV